MKKFLLLILLSNYLFSQDSFSYSLNGLTDYVVVNQNGSQKELYDRAIKWIKETYKNPNEVIKMTMENEKIRFEGFKENAFCINAMGSLACSDATYVIEISFKENKFKFDPINLNLSNKSGLKNEINLNDFTLYYNKKGQLNNQNRESLESFQKLFNELLNSIKAYKDDKINDW